VPAVLIVMNVVYAAVAFPAGRMSDRLNPRMLLFVGLVVLIVADLVLAFAPSAGWVLAGSALWGLHMALTQGLFAKLVADRAPAELRGTAFGVFHFGTGISLLLASVIAGSLWDRAGPSAAFLAGAGFAGIAALGLLVPAIRPAGARHSRSRGRH
jgi:MFS family permease